MGSGPSTPGIRLMTTDEAILGMPRRIVKSSSEQGSPHSETHKTSTAVVNNQLTEKFCASQINGSTEIVKASVRTTNAETRKINHKQEDTNQATTTSTSMKASAAGHDSAVANNDTKNLNGKQTTTTTSMSATEPDSTNTKVSNKQEDANEASLNNNSQTDVAVDKGDDQSNDMKSEKEKKRILTEEEIEEKCTKGLQNYNEKCALMSTIPPRDLEQEGAPFTQEFRQCLLSLAKSYFELKLGQVTYPVIKEYRNKVAAILLKHNTFKLMCDVLSDSLKRRDFIGEDFKMINASWLPMKNLLITLLNYSDASDEVKLIITEHPELLPCFVQLLNDWLKLSQENTLTENQKKLLQWDISIVHNCGSMEENIPRLRELGVIKAVLPYVESSSPAIRLSSIATLADLVNEEEAELLNACVSIFKFILKKIGKALKTENHKDVGWSAEELVRAARQLARNDANKKILVNEGCLPLLVEILEVGNEEETQEALHCIWALSFDDDNKKKMMDEPGLVEKVYSKYNTSDGGKRHTCHGILWSLRDELLSSEKCNHIGKVVTTKKSEAVMKTGVSNAVQETGATASTPKYNGHVMISYQWANQQVIKQITQELRAHGIPVWIDIDYMGGSTLQAMAQAVEESFIVIIAMSQKYKDSPNTRAEAEYAFQKRKKIIPLIMQQNYRPDGWLGLILGSKLFYDFSGKYSFESRMDGLLKAVNVLAGGDSTDCGEEALVPSKAGALAGAQPMTLSPLSPVAHPPPPRPPQPPPVDEEAVKQWTPADVTKWLTKYKLENTSLQSLSGEEILFLHNLRYEAPEFFYGCLEKKLQISSLLDLANTTKALSDLKL